MPIEQCVTSRGQQRTGHSAEPQSPSTPGCVQDAPSRMLGPRCSIQDAGGRDVGPGTVGVPKARARPSPAPLLSAGRPSLVFSQERLLRDVI